MHIEAGTHHVSCGFVKVARMHCLSNTCNKMQHKQAGLNSSRTWNLSNHNVGFLQVPCMTFGFSPQHVSYYALCKGHLPNVTLQA